MFTDDQNIGILRAARGLLRLRSLNLIRKGNDLADVSDEVVVLFVSADPKPDRQIPIAARDSAIAVSDPNRPNIPG